MRRLTARYGHRYAIQYMLEITEKKVYNVDYINWILQKRRFILWEAMFGVY